jgi:hypothetical protein
VRQRQRRGGGTAGSLCSYGLKGEGGGGEGEEGIFAKKKIALFSGANQKKSIGSFQLRKSSIFALKTLF